MISPELIRRFPFFAGLDHEQIAALANVAQEQNVDTGKYFFREGEELCCFYLLLEGAVGIVVELPDQKVEHTVAEQITGEFKTRDVVVTTVGPGEVFGWSGLVSPHEATAGAKALVPSRVVTFDCRELRKIFQDDCRFGYLMMEKIARLIRSRLRDLRTESLALYA